MGLPGKPGCPFCGGRGGKTHWHHGKIQWVKCRLCFPPMTKERTAWQKYANSIGAKNPSPKPDTKKQGRLFG